MLTEQFYFNEIMHFLVSNVSSSSYPFTNHTYMSTPCTFRNPESSIDSQNHCTKNNWPNFDNMVAMGDEEWEQKDIKEFTRLVENSEKSWEPASEKLEVINLENEQEKKELKIGTLVTTEERNKLVSLLREYADVFTWTYANMPGLDTDIVVHKILLIEGSKLVKQKTKRMRPDMLLKVKAEIQK